MTRPDRGAAEPRKFPLVCLGASAGGLAAFETFFAALPTEALPSASFVLVQHLDPVHPSLLPELIRRQTSLPVVPIEDGMVIQPRTVYVLTEGHDLEVRQGRLHWMVPQGAGALHLPIDGFFRSLAAERGAQAVAAVLSGTGQDGTEGLRAVGAAGGLVLVQTPSTADFSDMPAAALAANLPDAQGSPAELARLLPGLLSPLVPEENLDRVFHLLRERSGHDFSSYKPRTLHRRIERRMALLKTPDLEAYITLLESTPAEVDLLFQDLLIGVTQFFRDPGAFELLEKTVIPGILARHLGTGIRVWSAGCSTGEEAYSLAILFEEKMSTLGLECRLQIFATDIDTRAIALARTGRYPAAIAADVPAGRLARFFTYNPDELTYTVRKEIRDKIVFSEHDLVRDPPFSRLDLVVCRNLLIYLGADLQAKVLPLFNYALVPGGTLFLGNAETTGSSAPLFSSLDRVVKLYARLPILPEEPVKRRKITPVRPRTPAVSGNSEEELQAYNEELQSTNEELETSKEELQSLNEELSTVNAELQAKVGDLARANDDMNNLLAGTGIATVFIDQALRILRFTPAAIQIIPLLPGDVGRPLANLVTRLVDYDRLLDDAQAVLNTLDTIRHDVATADGVWFTLRLQPYRTRENLIQGVVISFVDITEIVTKRDALRKANDLLRLAVVVRDSHDAITVQDLEGRILAWNPGASRLYGWSEAEALGMNVHQRIPADLLEGAADEVRRLSLAPVMEPAVTRRLTKDGRVLTVSLVSTALVDEKGIFYAIATTERVGGGAMTPEEAQALIHELGVHQVELEMQNVELHRVQTDLLVSRQRYFELFDLAPVGYLTLAADGTVLETNLTASRLLGLDPVEFVGQPLGRFVDPGHRDLEYLSRNRLVASGLPEELELQLVPGGSRRSGPDSSPTESRKLAR